MVAKTDLSRFVRVVGWIDRYHEHFFKDPVKIDEEVERTNSNYLKRRWKKIREDVEKIWIQQNPLSNRLNILNKINGIILYGIFTGYVIVTFFDLEVLRSIIMHPVLLSILVALLFSFTIYRGRMKKKIRENSEILAEKLQKIRGVTQDLILHLCQRIMSEEKDPKKYEMEIVYPNYQGLAIKKRPGSFGPKYYKAVPSVAGLIISKAERYVKVVDPWPKDGESLNALRVAPSKLETKLLTSKEMSKDKRFRRTCLRVKNNRTGKFDVAAHELGDLNDRIIITKDKVWRTKEKEWRTIAEIPSAKIRALKRSFEEKWKKASILT